MWKNNLAHMHACLAPNVKKNVEELEAQEL
jgi:hypothetical protein